MAQIANLMPALLPGSGARINFAASPRVPAGWSSGTQLWQENEARGLLQTLGYTFVRPAVNADMPWLAPDALTPAQVAQNNATAARFAAKYGTGVSVGRRQLSQYDWELGLFSNTGALLESRTYNNAPSFLDRVVPILTGVVLAATGGAAIGGAVTGGGAAAAVDAGVGGSGLLAGTGTTGLVASAGEGLTLAATTGTGAGLAAGTGVNIIGAGIGASLGAAASVLPAIAPATASVDAGVGVGGSGLSVAPGSGLSLANTAPAVVDAGVGGSGLLASPGAGLTLAAPTGTGAGFAIGTGSSIIGAGLGETVAALPASLLSPGLAASVPAVAAPAASLPTLSQAVQAVKTIPALAGVVSAITGNAPTPGGQAQQAQDQATRGNLVLLGAAALAAFFIFKG